MRAGGGIFRPQVGGRPGRTDARGEGDARRELSGGQKRQKPPLLARRPAALGRVRHAHSTGATHQTPQERGAMAPAPLPVWGVFYKSCANQEAGPEKMLKQRANLLGLLVCVGAISGCGSFANDREDANTQLRSEGLLVDGERETIWDLFGGGADSSVTVEVNRYLWRASLEILDFMPVEAADPFTGIIAFGYATPPGGNRAYRATVYVSDPALEARSLRVALQGQGGSTVSRETARQVEDAILTRARQLRVADGRL